MREETNTEVTAKNTSKPRGRPLAFNQDEALERALQVFWLHGYEGASMAELVEALGINKPSIYAAFGNKEALFRKALAKYLTGPVAFIESVMHESTARKVAEKFLTGAAEFLTDQSHPMGCMIVQAALTCGKGSELIQQELIAYRKSLESNFIQRFELAKSQGDLPPDAQSADLAKFLTTLHQGMSVQATSGASRDELLAIARLALKSWPTND